MMDSMKRNGAWELVDLRDERKTIGCKWVYKTKRASNVSRLAWSRRVSHRSTEWTTTKFLRQWSDKRPFAYSIFEDSSKVCLLWQGPGTGRLME